VRIFKYARFSRFAGKEGINDEECLKKSGGINMKNKYNSDFLESLHETAVGLNNIGVISDKEMREYDKDCLVPTPKTSPESTSVPVKPTPVYAGSSRRT
jgi:hypothetical protein